MGNKEEQLTQEIGALLEEYRTLWEDSLKNFEASRQVLNYTLVFAGTLLAGSPFIMERNFPTLFLVIPIIFYALVWPQIRYLYLDNVLIDYSLEVLAPNLRKALGGLAPGRRKKFDTLLYWDAYLQEKEEKNQSHTFFPLQPLVTGSRCCSQ